MLISINIHYLSTIQKCLISNEMILFLITLLEILPLIHNIIESAFFLNSNANFKPFIRYLFYLSYYDQIHSREIILYKTPCMAIIIIIFSFFVLYRYFLIKFFYNKYFYFHLFMSNFYEIFVFRLFFIVFFDFLCLQIIKNSNLYSIFSFLLITILYFAVNYHLTSNYLYINFEKLPRYFLDNKINSNFDQYYFTIKMIICLIRNIEDNKTENKFLVTYFNIILFLSNIIISFFQTYILIRNPFVYLYNEVTVIMKYFLSVFLTFLGLSIILIKFQNNLVFSIIIIECAVIAGGISAFVVRYSTSKVLNIKNGIGIILFLLKQRFSPQIHTLISSTINKHLSICKDKKCKFCYELNQTKTQEHLTVESLCFDIFSYIIKDNILIIGRKDNEFQMFFHLIELYCTFVNNKKNFITTILKYHLIMTRCKNKNLNDKISKQRFPKNFLVNLTLLHHEISNLFAASNDSMYLSYIIQIDSFLKHINCFFDKVNGFFQFEIKDPKHFLSLSNSFTHLRKKVNCKFLSSKENRSKYSCIIVQYVMESIFNDRVNKGYYLNDVLFNYEDFLEQKFRDDNIIFALFNVKNASIVIKQCCKEFIDLKDNNFKTLFPSYLREEGHKRLFNVLTTKNDDYFEFYYQERKKGFIEKFKMKFMGLHSIGTNQLSLYILCQYLIEKKRILVFKNNYQSVVPKKILVSFSDNMSSILKIIPNQLKHSEESKNALTKNDFFSTNSKIIDVKRLKKKINEKLQIQNVHITMKKPLSIVLTEVIGQYEIYNVQEVSVGVRFVPSNSIITTLNPYSQKENSDSSKSNNTFNFEFEQTHLEMNSSVMTGSVFSTYTKTIRSIAKDHSQRYKHFYFYTHLLLAFHVFIFIIIGIYLAIQLTNNIKLENTFTVLKNFNDFQSYFYHSSLSVLSLTCNADYLTQTVCVNQFTEFCFNFSLENGLTEKEMMNDYLAKELPLKSELVINALKVWENDRYTIDCPELDDILNQPFIFDTIDEDGFHELKIISFNLTFEEAIKRIVNTMYQIPRYDNHLTAVIWTITMDGDGYYDLTNIKLDKEPINGMYLTPVQKLYYDMLINFQKYLLEMLLMTNALHKYCEDIIYLAFLENTIFFLVFLGFHLFMFSFGIFFIKKFKDLHMGFFLLIYDKISSKEFITYYFNKIEKLKILIDLYREVPNKIMRDLEKSKQNEAKRIKSEFTVSKDEDSVPTTPLPNAQGQVPKSSLIDKNKLNYLYILQVVFPFLGKLLFLFIGYFILCFILYFCLSTNYNNLKLMNKYIKYQYGVSNNIYLNLALLQVMSLTNQTDVQMIEYLNKTDSSYGMLNHSLNNGYVRKNLQKTLEDLSYINKLEQTHSIFYSLSSIVDLRCDSIYKELNDPIITSMTEDYPESDYIALLSKYCYVYSSLRSYSDEKMTLSIITYKTGKVLDLFIDQTYETYAVITNCLLIYQIYTEILMIVRPIRRYLYIHLLTKIIDNIISKYNMWIFIFIFFSVLYELLILFVVKIKVIKRIVHLSKEVIIVTQAFECL